MDALLADPRTAAWLEAWGRDPVRGAFRQVLEECRRDLAAGAPDHLSGSADAIFERVERRLTLAARPSLRRVINGTGVVLHTNLGRAPLAAEAVRAQAEAVGYGNVEFSLDTGERGSRYDHCAGLLCELTGAEAALVTNNNAAAVSLVVNELARGREVVVSRGELVEIGGSFRIPDVVIRSGARLREVGTTNRTRAADYEGALGLDTGLLLRVHPSNYRVEGFASRPDLADLVAVAGRAGLPLAHDIGSGLLDAALLPGFPPEPSVRDSLRAGADLVTWSGDKLLGGPQAGLIAGRAALVARLRRNPLLRAFRVDKTTLAALEATLQLHRDPDRAASRIPTLRMLRESATSIASRARESLARHDLPALPQPVTLAVETSRSVVGGGAFPGFELESAAWVVRGVDPDRLAAFCRAGEPPLVGRVRDAAFLVDLRTIPGGEEAEALGILTTAAVRAMEGT